MEEELLIIIIVVVIDAYKPPDSTGFKFMALTDWLRLLPASTPVCTKVVGGRVWTGISLSVSTIVKAPHPHPTSSNRSSHSRHKFFANTTYIQFNTLHYIFPKTLGIQFNKLHNFFANTTTTIILPISLQILQQQPQQQVLLSLSSVDGCFLFFFFFLFCRICLICFRNLLNLQPTVQNARSNCSQQRLCSNSFAILSFCSYIRSRLSLSLSLKAHRLSSKTLDLWGLSTPMKDQMSSRFQKRKRCKKNSRWESRQQISEMKDKIK